jgi:hypothetical protein
VISRWRRILEALRLAPPSPETVLDRAIKACSARLVRLPSGALYIETRTGQRLKVDLSYAPDRVVHLYGQPVGQLRARELAARALNRAKDETLQ